MYEPSIGVFFMNMVFMVNVKIGFMSGCVQIFFLCVFSSEELFQSIP